MSTYVLRDLPDELWARFRHRADVQGWPLRPLFLQLINEFTEGLLVPRGASPMSQYAWLRPTYRLLTDAMPDFKKMSLELQWHHLFNAVLGGFQGQAPLGGFQTQALSSIDPLRRLAILKWLAGEEDTTEKPITGLVIHQWRGGGGGGPKVAYFKFHDGDAVVSVPNVDTADEIDGRVVLHDPQARVVGRFSLGDVKSWWLQADSPKNTP